MRVPDSTKHDQPHCYSLALLIPSPSNSAVPEDSQPVPSRDPSALAPVGFGGQTPSWLKLVESSVASFFSDHNGCFQNREPTA